MMKKTETPNVGRAFLQYYTGNTTHATPDGGRTLHGARRTQHLEFDLSNKLPFWDLLIGTGDDTDKPLHRLTGLLDSGGCCNMGWRPYHKKMAKLFPSLVANVFEVEDQQYNDRKEIIISGIKGGVQITHMVEYWLPYEDRTGTATVILGLTEDLPVATLYGMPCQINTKIIINWDGQKATSKTSKTTCNIRMKRLK
jgi:hypothetical protein